MAPPKTPLWSRLYEHSKIWLAAVALIIFGLGMGLILGSILHDRKAVPKPVGAVTVTGPTIMVTHRQPQTSTAQMGESDLPIPVDEGDVPDAPAVAPMPGAHPDASPDLPPWKRFARPAPPIHGRPIIAIVIDDMGIDRKRSNRTVQLPGPLTLSYLPDGQDLPAQTAAAHRAGHELMLHMPMEPMSGEADPGPYALRGRLSDAENLRRLHAALARFDGYVGINNHMGSRFTASAPGMTLVMAELQRRGLLWLDSRTSPRTAGPMVARQFSMPWAERDVFLDDDPARPAVEKQLRQVEEVARRHGRAIAIGHPRDATLDVLEVWLRGLEAKGFVLVPLTEIVRRRQPAPVVLPMAISQGQLG